MAGAFHKGAQGRSLSDAVGGGMAQVFRDQLLIVLAKRLAEGGRLVIPASEIDATGQDVMTIDVDPEARTFTFNLGKKS